MGASSGRLPLAGRARYCLSALLAASSHAQPAGRARASSSAEGAVRKSKQRRRKQQLNHLIDQVSSRARAHFWAAERWAPAPLKRAAAVAAGPCLCAIVKLVWRERNNNHTLRISGNSSRPGSSGPAQMELSSRPGGPAHERPDLFARAAGPNGRPAARSFVCLVLSAPAGARRAANGARQPLATRRAARVRTSVKFIMQLNLPLRARVSASGPD